MSGWCMSVVRSTHNTAIHSFCCIKYWEGVLKSPVMITGFHMSLLLYQFFTYEVKNCTKHYEILALYPECVHIWDCCFPDKWCLYESFNLYWLLVYQVYLACYTAFSCLPFAWCIIPSYYFQLLLICKCLLGYSL